LSAGSFSGASSGGGNSDSGRRGGSSLSSNDTGGSRCVRALDDLSGSVVGDSVSESTSTVPSLGDHGTGALASGESTTIGRTVGVFSADSGDELSAGGLASARSGNSDSSRRGGSSLGGNDTRGSRRVRALNDLSGSVIGDSIPESTSAVPSLGDYGTSTFAGGESTAVGGTGRIVDAGASNELRSQRDTGEDGGAGEQGQVGDEESAEHSKASHLKDWCVVKRGNV